MANKKHHIISAFGEMKEDPNPASLTPHSYKKTSESMSHAGERATAAFSSVGLAVSRTLEDVR